MTLADLPTSKTVVFGEAGAPSVEQRKTSNAHIWFFVWTVAIPAAIALTYVAFMSATVSTALATTLPWKIGIGLLVVALTAALGALPIIAGLMWAEDDRPIAYAALVLLVLVCLPIAVFSAGAHAYYAMHSAPKAEPKKDRPLIDFEPRKESAILLEIESFPVKRFFFKNPRTGVEYQMTMDGLVERTGECRNFSRDAFEADFQRAFCDDWRRTRAELAERRRLDALAATGAAGIEAMLSGEAITAARWFIAVWGPAAALLFGLLGFAVAGGVIGKMILLSTPPAPTPATIAEPIVDILDPAPTAAPNYFGMWSADCVGLDETATMLKPPAIWQSFVDWSTDIGYPGQKPPLSQPEFQREFSARYGKHKVHRGTQGGTTYDGLVLWNSQDGEDSL
jgi:hypothetical protein